MSQTNPKYSEFEIAQKRDRRGPAPITNLPVNALTDEVDPTQEIRNLINELQSGSRDARAKLHDVEHERDELAAKLEHASYQITEFRQQFVEITAVLRDRDAAMENAERLARQLRDLERKLEAVSRERHDSQRHRDDAVGQRDDALRQRDEAVRRCEENNRSVQESAAQLAHVQKQVLSIRQARDNTQSQKRELEVRLGRSEDELAELTYEREALQKTAEKATEEAADFRRQLDAVTHDRDATIKQVADLQSELDAQRTKVLDLTEQKSAVAMADSEHASALAEARAQVISLTQERDAARTRAQEQAREIEEIREQMQELRNQNSESTVLAAEFDEIKRQLAALSADRDLHVARQKELLAETDSQQERLAAITDQLAAAQRGREEALTSLTSAQKQIDLIISDRDAVRQQSVERALEIESQIASLRKQMTELEQRAGEASQRIDAAHRERNSALEKAERFEQQRLQSIDLAAQLDAKKRDILSLSADLAEARLQVKFAQALRSNATAATTTPAPATPAAGPPPVEIHLDLPPSTSPEPYEDEGPSPADLTEPFTEKEAKGILNAMKQCFQSFSKNPSDLSLLNELHCHAHSFAETARVTGCVALHRLTSSLAGFAQELYKYPEQVNPSALRTVTQTLDFLGVLIKQKDYATLKDPVKAMIYAVDDDADNCDAIKMSMESVMLRTQTAQEPAIALAELANGSFDLIFLDVNMPHMGGFELCQNIRQLPNHARTPIVFLTGLTTMENRVQSNLSGANDFVGKPFNLNELSLKALMLILKSSLGIE
jgi:CheY-like chemotaxis protein/uncharacterized coiled-coil DUF342 family protein